MEKAKVYFTDFRTPYGGDTMPGKLKKLIRKAGIAQLNLEGQDSFWRAGQRELSAA